MIDTQESADSTSMSENQCSLHQHDTGIATRSPTESFNTLATIKHPGIQLCGNIDNTRIGTLQKTDLNADKCRILATAPPADILNGANLVNLVMGVL
jgi:hypothetical protein